jgi:hypothetical protein
MAPCAAPAPRWCASTAGKPFTTALCLKMDLFHANGARLEAGEPFAGLVLKLEEIGAV